MEQTNIAVEVAKKNLGPATSLTSDDAAGTVEAAPGVPLDARNGLSCENRRRRVSVENAGQ